MFEPGTLWELIERCTSRALNSGHLQPIATRHELVREGQVQFLVRIIDNLSRKQSDRAAAGKSVRNPFLPYDEALFVADVSPSHVGLLNKYNVVDHHLLIVTREYQDQQSALDLADFEALWRCMAEFEGLGFYNSAPAAGASQSHKHLQLVPLPLGPDMPRIPLESLIESATFSGVIGRAPLPFLHSVGRLDGQFFASPQDAASTTHLVYQTMLEAADAHKLAPYNLLVTRDWMLLVPRSQEHFDSISLNALAFAGALLVRDEEQLQRVKEVGPMRILQHAAITE